MINQLNNNAFFFSPPDATAGKQASADALPAPPPGSEYAPEAFEAHMNGWYQSRVAFENGLKTAAYRQALENWQLNNEQRQALGLPSTPKPEAPVPARVEPMPAGFWFGRTDGSSV